MKYDLILLPHITAFMIMLLNQLDKHVNFQDHGFLGLPMAMFTEIWVPLIHATEVTSDLRDYFNGIKSAGKYERTGNNAWEQLHASRSG